MAKKTTEDRLAELEQVTASLAVHSLLNAGDLCRECHKAGHVTPATCGRAWMDRFCEAHRPVRKNDWVIFSDVFTYKIQPAAAKLIEWVKGVR